MVYIYSLINWIHVVITIHRKSNTMADKRFRGNWSPSIGNPNAFAFKFLPTPPPQKPKAKKNAPPLEPVIIGELFSFI